MYLNLPTFQMYMYVHVTSVTAVVSIGLVRIPCSYYM